MKSRRLEVRLDEEHRRKLAQVAEASGVSASDAVRQLIDSSYEETQHVARLRAVAAIGRLQIEEVPDPETLNAQLDAVHDVPDLS